MPLFSDDLFVSLHNHVLHKHGLTGRIETKFCWLPPCHKYVFVDEGKVLYKTFSYCKMSVYVSGYIEGKGE